MENVLQINSNNKTIFQILENAEKFITIAVFQLTSKKIIDLLINKVNEGLKVEVLTLPEDSFRKVKERNKIVELYSSMIQNGIKLYRCDWEVGDPTLTDTSQSGTITEGGGSKWYSFHGKFIVTDQCALITSANLVDEQEWQVYLQLNKDFIPHFQEKFDKLHSLFIDKSSNEKIYGKIYDRLTENIKVQLADLWDKNKRKNIAQYPPELSPESELSIGLHISPFDGRSRNFLYQMINKAQTFFYISSETLYDQDLVDKLKQKALASDINIQLLTTHPRNVRQNPSKAESFVIDLLASGVKYNVLEDVHVKCWLSDTWLMIGSPGLSKMSLGFKKTKNFWRSNTETLFLINDPSILVQAKKEFEELVSQSVPGFIAISEKPVKIKQSAKLFKTLGIRSKKNARVLLSRIETKLQLKLKSDLTQIVKTSEKIAKALNDSFVEEIHVIMSLILYFLQERKHAKKELQEKMFELTNKLKITEAIENLLKMRYCIKKEDNYMINIDKL